LEQCINKIEMRRQVHRVQFEGIAVLLDGAIPLPCQEVAIAETPMRNGESGSISSAWRS
jgi:hypothetical protein